jgi:hypothetical protein
LIEPSASEHALVGIDDFSYCRVGVCLSRLIGGWGMKDRWNALRAHTHCQKAKWTLSLIAPTVPCRPGLQKDLTLVERLLLPAISELDGEISLKDVEVDGHRMGHPTRNTTRRDGQNV